MSPLGTASQIVAAFAANFDPSRLGEDHVVLCGRALADTMAVAIAAQNEAVVRHACDYVETLTPPPQPPSIHPSASHIRSGPVLRMRASSSRSSDRPTGDRPARTIS